MSKGLNLIYALTITLFWSITAYSQNIKLIVSGATEKETKVIDSIGYNSSFKDFQTLQNEVSILKTKIEKTGYLENRLVELKRKTDSAYTANFSLGSFQNYIYVRGKNLIPRDILKMINAEQIAGYLKIRTSELEETMEIINAEMANLGNPFSRLKLTSVSKISKDTLAAQLTTTEQEVRRIDKIIVKGYEKFPKSFIRHYLKIKKGQIFNLSSIIQKTEDLDNLQFANIIRDPEVLFTQDSTTLYMYIEKNRSNTFDGFLGFGTNENTNNLEFDGYLDLRLTNNLNYGEALELLYKSDENDQQTLDITLRTHFLFNSPIGAEFNLNIFRRDSTFSTTRQVGKLNYQIDARHLVSFGITNENSTNLQDDNSALFINDYDAIRYIGNYQYLKRQSKNILFPINFLFNLSTGFGNRTAQESKNEQYYLELETFKIFNLNQRNSIYGRITAHYLDSNDYLENELPRFGGINSIRGFEENSLIANLYAVLNTEYRYKLSNSIYAHSVIDAAYFENQITEQKEKLFGFGFGFGLLTKAGLFRFNYTSAKTQNQPFRLSDSKIHVSLTALF